MISVLINLYSPFVVKNQVFELLAIVFIVELRLRFQAHLIHTRLPENRDRHVVRLSVMRLIRGQLFLQLIKDGLVIDFGLRRLVVHLFLVLSH